jgi:hypothetical protein
MKRKKQDEKEKKGEKNSSLLSEASRFIIIFIGSKYNKKKKKKKIKAIANIKPYLFNRNGAVKVHYYSYRNKLIISTKILFSYCSRILKSVLVFFSLNVIKTDI